MTCYLSNATIKFQITEHLTSDLRRWDCKSTATNEFDIWFARITYQIRSGQIRWQLNCWNPRPTTMSTTYYALIRQQTLATKNNIKQYINKWPLVCASQLSNIIWQYIRHLICTNPMANLKQLTHLTSDLRQTHAIYVTAVHLASDLRKSSGNSAAGIRGQQRSHKNHVLWSDHRHGQPKVKYINK